MLTNLPSRSSDELAEVPKPRDLAYAAYQPNDELPELVREVDGWSIYRPGGRVARFVGPGSKRRALAKVRSVKAAQRRGRGRGVPGPVA